MKQVKLDDSAIGILVDVKKTMKRKGISGPTYSGAVRYLYSKYTGQELEEIFERRIPTKSRSGSYKGHGGEI